MRSACAEAGLTAYWEPFILVREGWCAIQRGEVEQGTEAIRTGLNAFVARGGKMLVAYFTTYLAEALAASGDAAEGLRVLDEARAKYTVTDELYGEAEIQRTRGELLMALPEPRPIEAEAAFRSAIEVAQSLEAKWQELRATTSFARLLQSQHRETEAREMLSGIYGGGVVGGGESLGAEVSASRRPRIGRPGSAFCHQASHRQASQHHDVPPSHSPAQTRRVTSGVSRRGRGGWRTIGTRAGKVLDYIAQDSPRGRRAAALTPIRY
jgi:hypothetical protein